MAALIYKVTHGRIPLVNTIKVGSLLRTSIMAQYGRHNHGCTSPAFAGKDASGKPLSGHCHAFFIPLDIDGDGKIDHMMITRNSGFNAREVAAMSAVHTLRSKRDNIDAGLAVQHYDMSSHNRTAMSRKWVSLTPFLLTRHPKNRAGKTIDAPDDQIRLEILRRLPAHSLVETTVYADDKPMILSRLRPSQYVRSRKLNEPRRPAYEVKIELDMGVVGPLLLGYGCHYGMGHFVPDTMNNHEGNVERGRPASSSYLAHLCHVYD